jgi:MinD superfamily P-loop ATPase
MKQLVVLSGKGGTGKTSICAAFAHLLHQSLVCTAADADVDAANMSLMFDPINSLQHDFWGGSIAKINAELCSGCETCKAVCRYDAILLNDGKCQIDAIACEGCAACLYACPEKAIRMVPQKAGHWYQSSTQYGDLFHAELFPGKENSGKLVTMVKQQARLRGEETGAAIVLIDGPPGTGCPVISACAGADLGLVVTEPGLSGLHDLKRILGVLQHFRVPAVICLNKADIYPAGAAQIREYAEKNQVVIAGEIPFDEHLPQSILLGTPVTKAFPGTPASISIQMLLRAVLMQLGDEKETN